MFNIYYWKNVGLSCLRRKVSVSERKKVAAELPPLLVHAFYSALSIVSSL